MFIKLMAWGFRTYWADYWNKLDFILVNMSVVTFVFEHVIMQKFPGACVCQPVPSPEPTPTLTPTLTQPHTVNASIFRILRLARLTKAMKALKTLRRVRGVAQLIDTLVLTLPAMANVAALLFLAIFIFSVLGMR